MTSEIRSASRANLELVKKKGSSDHLDAIERALERMEVLIDDVLTLAREGEQVHETEVVALATVAERSWQNVATDEATFLAETESTIRADQSRLERFLENQFRNAVEHGGDEVTVTISDLGEGGGFAVADDGPGISEDDRDQIFDPGVSTTEDGTGFGLAIIREIAQAHGWEITVTESGQGGARFEVTGVEVVW